jgi:5-methylcytosine-specific restriction endonuclease McrA
MSNKPTRPPRKSRAEQIVAEGRRARAEFDSGYRGQALKILPWVCASCGRDFDSKNLSELTVHHKDHDHTNNPPDGSNWELLCYWCHENEHGRLEVAEASAAAKPGERPKDRMTHNPFAGLVDLLGDEDPGKGD